MLSSVIRWRTYDGGCFFLLIDAFWQSCLQAMLVREHVDACSVNLMHGSVNYYKV
jgi:hypothetical protein